MKAGFSVLIADDDRFSRQTAARMMVRLGAGSVTEAVNGHEALRCAQACAGRLDLIICDLKMPQMDGIETLRGLAAQNSAAAIVLASGADTRVLRAARDMAATLGIRSLRTIGKPLTLQGMRQILEEIGPGPGSTGETGTGAGPAPLLPALLLPDGLAIDAGDILRGVAAGEFVAYFQPKVDLRSNAIRGAEALIRWEHPAHGTLSPAAFLTIAHAAGLSYPITELMLAQAAAACAGWRRLGLDMSVSVNLPVACISHQLPELLDNIVSGQGLDPQHVILELVEDGWLKSHAIGQEVLTRLRLRGFGLSIDDFGTGFSSLQQLLQAPFNEMKIDRSFVQSAPDDPESAVALLSSIGLAQSLGLLVVGEGVETETHRRFLHEAGCDLAQGYLMTSPLPGPLFVAWVREWLARHAQAPGRAARGEG